jgi:hypothetical protein
MTDIPQSRGDTVSPKSPTDTIVEPTAAHASNSLCKMFIEHAGYVSDKWEHYLPIYEAAFAGFIARGQPVRLLEIGVQNGGSLQIWSKFLPAGSSVIGIDIDPTCASFAVEPNISIRIGDASSPNALDRMLSEARFDVIIDDGSHRSEEVVSTFRACFERLDPGGLYIVEDLHCSYRKSHGGGFRLAGAAIEQFKNLADALNADHFDSDAATKLESDELERLQQLGKEIARVSFFDSLVIVERLGGGTRNPYKRVIAGREAHVADVISQIALDPYAIRKLLLPHAAADAFIPILLEKLASSREEVGQSRAELAQWREDRQTLRAEIARQSDEAEALRAEMARQNGEAEMLRRVANQTAEQLRTASERISAAEHELAQLRARAGHTAEHASLMEAESSAAAAKGAELDRALAEAHAEQARLRHELDDLLHSTFWQITGPVRRAASVLPPGLRRQGRRGARVVYWVLTPHRTRERIAYFRKRAKAPVLADSNAMEDSGAAAATDDVVPADTAVNVSAAAESLESCPQTIPAYDELLRRRFSFLEPLRTFEAPHHGPRVTIVTDSINSGHLYGGVATAIILAALLARRLDAGLRLVTRTEVPVLDNIGTILRTHGVLWTGNVEWIHSPPGRGGHDIPITREDLFLTTSWWTTRATRGAIPPAQIVYMLGEDERMFYPMGDDQLLCAETLSDPSLLYIVNSNLLLHHLQSEGMTPNGVAFEPAFPDAIYYPDRSAESNRKRTFFFYARPNNLRNLYWRGITAIATALEEGVLDPAQWDFYLVGKDTPQLVLPRKVRPRVLHNLPWAEYGALVRRIDVGLSLMYTPHPSYPPLDLAASGAIVVTNRFGSKVDLSCYSRNILCVEPTVRALVSGISRAVALAQDRKARAANAAQVSMPRDWGTALAPILDYLAERRLKG